MVELSLGINGGAVAVAADGANIDTLVLEPSDWNELL